MDEESVWIRYAKMRIKKKLIKYVAIVFVVVSLVSAIIAALYNSPAAIFLPSLSEDHLTTTGKIGYDEIATELENYYVSFNNAIYSLKATTGAEVSYTDSHSNFWDVIKIYVCLTYDGETGVNPSEMTDENRKLLKEVFDALNFYEQTTVKRSYVDGDMLGTYKIISGTDETLYGTDAVYGECIVDAAKMPLVPVKSVISFNKSRFRVVGTAALSDSAAIKVLITEKQKAVYKGGTYEVSFSASEEIPEIVYEEQVIDVTVLSAEDYIKEHPLSSKQMEFYEMVEGERERALSDSQQESADIISTPLNLTQQEFVSKVGGLARENYTTSKILPSLVIAQACLESGYGTTKLSSECFNFFGMKWVDGCGCDYREYVTTEQRADGTYYSVVARFRKYASIEDGIAGYYAFINYPRYQNLVGETDYKNACRLIREDGWATDLNYTQKLIRIIVSYNLTEYDDVVESED